jgi:hypothetical protein
MERKIKNSKPTKSFVRDKLKVMNPFPKRITWAVIRQIFALKPGISHKEIPGGTKKMVRLAHAEIRAERAKQTI